MTYLSIALIGFLWGFFGVTGELFSSTWFIQILGFNLMWVIVPLVWELGK